MKKNIIKILFCLLYVLTSMFQVCGVTTLIPVLPQECTLQFAEMIPPQYENAIIIAMLLLIVAQILFAMLR